MHLSQEFNALIALISCDTSTPCVIPKILGRYTFFHRSRATKSRPLTLELSSFFRKQNTRAFRVEILGALLWRLMHEIYAKKG